MSLKDVQLARDRWHVLTAYSPLYDSRLMEGGEDVSWEHIDNVPKQVDQIPALQLSWDQKFQPDYAPYQMLAMGAFGDAYFNSDLGQIRCVMLPQNYPLRIRPTGGPPAHGLNYYGKKSGESRDWWLDKSLIFNYDPLGWFEWYCWYWLGRRIPHYDAWQIVRWTRFKKRQLAYYQTTRYTGVAQALLHWAVRVE